MFFFGSTRPTSSAQRRRRRTALWSAPVTILVSSTLVINACHAAPQRLPAIDEQHPLRGSIPSSSSSFASSFSSQVEQAVVGAGRVAPQWKGDRPAEMFVHTPSPTTVEGGDSGKAARSYSTHKIQRRTHTLSTLTNKNIVVPSSFASTIASSWDPRQRSVWFQRKAVIITSVFLAILIVLIIGAAAFIRDKREEEAEDEVDVSDEAALKRMREEREMRNAGRHSKGKKGGSKREAQGAGQEQAGCGASTAIVYRWAKIPTRKLRKNKTRSLKSPSRVSVASQELELTPQSSSNRNAGEADGGQTSSHEMHTSLSSSSGLQRTSTDSHSNRQASSATRENLSAADVTAVDAAMDRQLNAGTHDEAGDAFPPAYIASHSRAAGQLHPSADRRLAAGQAATSSTGAAAAASASASEKQPLPSDSEAPAEGGESSALPPSIEDFNSPRQASGDNHYSAHIATDDKTMLGQLQNAASTPGGVPSLQQDTMGSDGPDVPGTASASASAAHHATAPTLDDDNAGDEELTEEEIRQIEGGYGSSKEKGKSIAAGSSLLPAPPSALTPSAYNPFDTPYSNAPSAPPAAPSSPSGPIAPADPSSSEKAREAEQENRRALALVESKPDDMAHLPLYESTPSAPPPPDLDEGEEDAQDGSEEHGTSPTPPASVAPSAPPL